MTQHTQQAGIKATMTPRIDKFDAAGNFLETVELEPREVWLTAEQVEGLGLTVPPAEAPAPASQGD